MPWNQTPSKQKQEHWFKSKKGNFGLPEDWRRGLELKWRDGEGREWLLVDGKDRFTRDLKGEERVVRFIWGRRRRWGLISLLLCLFGLCFGQVRILTTKEMACLQTCFLQTTTDSLDGNTNVFSIFCFVALSVVSTRLDVSEEKSIDLPSFYV